MSLKAKSVKGIFWSGTGRVVRQVLGLGLTAVFARLLTPRDFGLLTMVMVFQGFAGLFRTLGLGTAVIQRRELSEEQLTAVFFLNLFMGVLLSALIFLGAPLIAWFYEEPSLARIAQITCVGFIFTCVTVVHEALLVKRLQFHRVVMAEFFAFLAAGTLAVVAAFKGLGVYALVINTLASLFFSSLFVFIANPWMPKAPPNWRSARGLMGFGMNVMGMNVLNYLHRHTDDLLVGKFLGSIQLGYYSMAYKLMRLPTRQISGVVSAVAFPAFSSIQEDVGRIRRGFLMMSRYIGLLLFPALMGLIVVAPEAIPVPFGEKWRPAVFVIQILTVAGVLQSVQSPMSTLFMSRGRPNLLLRYQILCTICYVTAFLVSVRWGINGVAVFYTGVTILLSPLLYRLAFGLIRMKASDYFSAMKEPFLGSLAMAAIVFGYRSFCVQNGMTPWLLLITEVALGILVYPLVLWLMDRKLYRETVDLLRLLTRREKTGHTPAVSVVEER